MSGEYNSTFISVGSMSSIEGANNSRLPYIVCMASVTIFVHPFPLTPYAPTVLAVLGVNLLVFVGCYVAMRVSRMLWRCFRVWRQQAGGLRGWMRNWQVEVSRRIRSFSLIGTQRDGDAAGGAVGGLEMAARGTV